jgi:ribosomal protein S18 acetylase RimI-like enzyme
VSEANVAQPDLELRPAEPGEAAAIRDVVRAAYAKWVAVIGREPRPMQADYQKALHEHQFDVVVEDGQIIGLIETMQHPDHLWIENVAVLPAAQGRGIGRRLLSHAEHKARTAGRAEIRLLTNGAFAANLSLYSSLGYAVDRQEEFMNGVAVYMSKRLAQ